MYNTLIQGQERNLHIYVTYTESLCPWNAQFRYVIPGTRISNHQDNKALKMNGMQAINPLEVQEIQYLRICNFVTFIQLFI
jgi:hypothetical protein